VSDTLRTQRDVTRIALRALTDTGFALAGGSAVREHGITTRPTEDVDLFTSHPDADAFSAAVGMVIDALRDAGYQVTQTRTAEQFARLHITSVSKASVIVDMGVDWRMNQPTPLDIGPVLSLEDAVGNKVAALFSRGEPRDYLDVDAIRGWGGFSAQPLWSGNRVTLVVRAPERLCAWATDAPPTKERAPRLESILTSNDLITT
jgi:hypothetical protein